MRVAQVAPLAESVPPKFYGGTERVVSWLSEELVRLGHEVTLFASGDSRTAGQLVPVIPKGLRLGRPRYESSAAMALLLEEVAARASSFDIIHCHIDWIQLPLLRLLGKPFVTTLHGRLDLPGLAEVVSAFPGAPLVSISDNQRKPLPEAYWAGTVYHGLPLDLYQPSREAGHYLAFLGRVSPEKGADTAIRIASRAGMPLRIAAKKPRTEARYFREVLGPLIEERNVCFTGELDDRGKNEFLRDAAGLVFPIRWPEPFGLVMIESMACGTPVIAYRHGSVPEVVDEGVTGFIVDTEEEAAEAVSRLGQLDRRRVRERFEERFTARRMAQDYLHLYASLLQRSPKLQSATSAYPAKRMVTLDAGSEVADSS